MSSALRQPSCCPVCQARFRGVAQCSRCGADLTPLMLLTARAYLLRQTARRSLRQGHLKLAMDAVQAAHHLRATPEGDLLGWICGVSQALRLSEYDDDLRADG